MSCDASRRAERHTAFWSCLFAAALAVGASCHGDTEDGRPVVEELRLTDREEFAEPFWRIAGVVELRSPERAVVYDAGERRIFVVDFAEGTRSEPTTVGSGPLEYRTPGILMGGAGHEPIYHDMSQRRLLFFTDSGAPMRTVSYMEPTAQPSQREVLPRRAIASGFIYGTPTARQRRFATDGNADAAQPLRRVDLNTGRAATLFHLRPTQTRVESTTSSDGHATVVVYVDDLVAPDAWTVLPDGRVASLRDGEYRLRVTELDGHEAIGPPVPHAAASVTEADRQNALAAANAIARGQANPAVRTIVREPAEFATHKPPYAEIEASPRGHVWVALPLTSADSGRRYDILDTDGLLLARVWLSPAERLVGLGRDHVYTSRTDSDGQARLRRYRVPPMAE